MLSRVKKLTVKYENVSGGVCEIADRAGRFNCPTNSCKFSKKEIMGAQKLIISILPLWVNFPQMGCF